jgi:hypothetical protein
MNVEGLVATRCFGAPYLETFFGRGRGFILIPPLVEKCTRDQSRSTSHFSNKGEEHETSNS